jgi:hypothetical protein
MIDFCCQIGIPVARHQKSDIEVRVSIVMRVIYQTQYYRMTTMNQSVILQYKKRSKKNIKLI